MHRQKKVSGEPILGAATYVCCAIVFYLGRRENILSLADGMLVDVRICSLTAREPLPVFNKDPLLLRLSARTPIPP